MFGFGRALVFLLVTGLVTASAGAQHMNSATAPCRAQLATIDLYDCFAKAFAQQDAQLNQIYGQIRGVLQAGEQRQLQQAERMWLQYGDATCSAKRALYAGGTGGPPTEMACREALTRERIAVLRITYGWRVEKGSNKSSSGRDPIAGN